MPNKDKEINSDYEWDVQDAAAGQKAILIVAFKWKNMKIVAPMPSDLFLLQKMNLQRFFSKKDG